MRAANHVAISSALRWPSTIASINSNDCDFKSGSLLYYSFIGKTSCGTPSNNETGESLPIHIEGADLTVPKLYTVGVNPASRFVPGGESAIIVDFTNKTTTLSDSADEVNVKLPAGVRYKANSSVGVLPVTWIPGEPRSRILGDIQMLTWYQPRGLMLNETGTLRFTVTTPDTIACDGGLRAIGLAWARFAAGAGPDFRRWPQRSDERLTRTLTAFRRSRHLLPMRRQCGAAPGRRAGRFEGWPRDW